jgi:hypothetical protein
MRRFSARVDPKNAKKHKNKLEVSVKFKKASNGALMQHTHTKRKDRCHGSYGNISHKRR